MGDGIPLGDESGTAGQNKGLSVEGPESTPTQKSKEAFMSDHEKEGEKDVAESILGAVDKIIPGFKSFYKKGETSKTFGPRMNKIREEINRRFGKK